MRFDPILFAEVLREQGFDAQKIRRIMYAEGYGHQAIADATVPPRTLDERIERLRAAGASIRTTAACVGVSKSKLHYMLSPDMRDRHNKRASGRHYDMTQEHVTAILMAMAELTAAVKAVAVKLDAANELAKRR